MSERTGYYFDVNSWRNSRSVRLMNHETRGLYREILDEIWINGSVPDNPKLIAKLTDTPLSVVEECWPTVLALLVALPGEPTKFTSLRMEEERLKRDELREQQVKAGKASGAARAAQARARVEQLLTNGRSTGVEHPLNVRSTEASTDVEPYKTRREQGEASLGEASLERDEFQVREHPDKGGNSVSFEHSLRTEQGNGDGAKTKDERKQPWRRDGI
jgi:hypothetical protein